MREVNCPICSARFAIDMSSIEHKVPENQSSAVSGTKNTQKEGVVSKNKVKDAVPKLSDYKERYKSKKLTISDVVAKPSVIENLPRQDKQLDNFRHNGDSLFFGPGVEREY